MIGYSEAERRLERKMGTMAFSPQFGAYPQASAATTAVYDAGLRAYMLRVYNWMASGLLLTGIISGFVVGYLVLAFELFYHGLQFIAKFPGLGAVLTERLLYTLFAFLFALLLLSNLIISYTNLFRNRETAFLLSLPVS